MNAKTKEKLKETLCKNLDTLADRTLDDLALKHIQMLTDSYKNLLKIEMLEDVGEEYYGGESRNSYRYYDGSYGDRSYGDGNSYARRGEHYVRGHYSRGHDDDMSMRYSRRSYADGKDHVMRELETIMGKATNDQDREAIRRCMTQIENA